MAEPPDPDTVRCPTCRAEQAWSDTCRRCKSDLRLLREAAGSYHENLRACLSHLRTGRARAALRAARRCHALSPSADSRRLLAVSALLAGDWPTATDASAPIP